MGIENFEQKVPSEDEVVKGLEELDELVKPEKVKRLEGELKELKEEKTQLDEKTKQFKKFTPEEMQNKVTRDSYQEAKYPHDVRIAEVTELIKNKEEELKQKLDKIN